MMRNSANALRAYETTSFTPEILYLQTIPQVNGLVITTEYVIYY